MITFLLSDHNFQFFKWLGDGSDADNLLLEKVREEDKGSEEAYKWLFDAVSLGQNIKKKDEKDEVK